MHKKVKRQKRRLNGNVRILKLGAYDIMYRQDCWKFRDSNEYEIKYPGRYGAKGEKRAKKRKATPEQIKRQNQANREKNIRRLIKKNFRKSDLWCTLMYPKGTRLSVEEYKKHIKLFLDRLRRWYKKAGAVCKFIYRLEIGKAGGVHLHILLPRVYGKDTDIAIQKAWIYGTVDYKNIYKFGGYAKLADYIVKPPKTEEEWEQITMFPEEDRKTFLKYSTSRNLIRPLPESKTYTRRTVRKMIEEGPKPTPGYYIEKETVVSGINPYTGLSYIHYTETKIKEITEMQT